ncbi:MAG: zeta toxin family protein [Candidatus Omnitrophica bacterium]|jgi:predicted ABC-type ATPase|nr:zeta toxin family protein [Candidatus Omnitrophota bacterium]MDD5691113.1 zeta toxin family protein [Candidatus Omnitrophota bacterium]
MKTGKNVYIIAGPNGSGKTTFANKFLPDYAECPNFVNADLIAQGLSPFSPRTAAIKAGRLVLGQIHEFAEKGVDFGFETTLSGKSYVNLLKELREKEYKLHLFFLWIPGPQLALERIKERVSEGGHDIPAQDVRRRFNRSITNFLKLYQPLLDSWIIFNNAGVIPELIAKSKDGNLVVSDENLFDRILKNGE